MTPTIQQIVADAILDFITRRRTAAQIIEDIKRAFNVREQVAALAEALSASDNPDLQEAGKVLRASDLLWLEQTRNDYLRGTNILIDKPCTCADPSEIDQTCPLATSPEHEKLVVSRWVERMIG